MNQTQAKRLLDLGLDFVGRYDSQGNRVSGWQKYPTTALMTSWSSDRVAQRSWSGIEGRLARLVAVDEITGILTILIPIPGGGLIVGAIERWLIDSAAQKLADELEAAVKREFGENWAPIIAAGIGAVALFALLASRRFT